MGIIMKSSRYRVISIVKKTGAYMFKDIQVGDVLEFSVPLEYAGSHKGISRTVSIKVANLRQANIASYKTFNQLPRLLSYFELEEMHPKESITE